jgi:hypothetical protein
MRLVTLIDTRVESSWLPGTLIVTKIRYTAFKARFQFELAPLQRGNRVLLRTPHQRGLPGRAVQVDPIKPTLKAPGTKRLKLKCDELLQKLLSVSTCTATTWHGACSARRGAAAIVSRKALWWGGAISWFENTWLTPG